MNFGEAIRISFRKYAVISGRAGRPEFWWWALFIALGNFVFGALDGAVFGAGDTRIFGAAFGLATFLPTLCVAGRRLHDRDMTAWWLLLWLIPVLGWLIVLFLCALEGTRGPNRFGPDPRAGDDPASRIPEVDRQP